MVQAVDGATYSINDDLVWVGDSYRRVFIAGLLRSR